MPGGQPCQLRARRAQHPGHGPLRACAPVSGGKYACLFCAPRLLSALGSSSLWSKEPYPGQRASAALVSGAAAHCPQAPRYLGYQMALCPPAHLTCSHWDHCGLSPGHRAWQGLGVSGDLPGVQAIHLLTAMQVQ